MPHLARLAIRPRIRLTDLLAALLSLCSALLILSCFAGILLTRY